MKWIECGSWRSTGKDELMRQPSQEAMRRSINAQPAEDDRVNHMPLNVNTPISKTQLNSVSFLLVKEPKQQLMFLPQKYSEKMFVLGRLEQHTEPNVSKNLASIVNQMTAEGEQALTHQRPNIVSEAEPYLLRHGDEQITQIRSESQPVPESTSVCQQEGNVSFQ